MTLISSRRAMVATGTLLFALGGCAQKHPHQSHDAHPAHWSYSGETGPAHWGSLAPEYALCSTGRQQSPIDIQSSSKRDIANVRFSYERTAIEIINNGHTVQVNYAPGSHIELDGERFELAQFHFHSPSEHMVNGAQAAAEMHLVHKSAAGKLAVVGVLIQEGAHNRSFDPIWSNLPGKEGPAKRVDASVDADDLLPTDQRTYRYDGSLTTPPGTEGVKWCLMVEPVSMSKSQIAEFRKVYHGNNRPPQSLNGRTVVEDTTR